MFIMFIIKDISLVGTYYALNKIFEKYYDKKVARNFVCVAHASTSVVMNTIYFITGNYLNLALDVSKGYFLYDIYYMLRYDVKHAFTYAYICHHLATLCCIYRNIPGSSLPLLLGELSNLPTYMVYYTIKTDKKNTKKALAALHKEFKLDK